jgi:hypothetical protein
MLISNRKLMSDFFGKIRRGAEEVAFEADKTLRVKRVEGDIGQLKRQRDAQFMKIGEITYRHQIEQKPGNPEITEFVKILTELEQQISAREAEIKRINTETYISKDKPAFVSQSNAPPYVERQPNSPQTTPVATSTNVKFCTNCGKEIGENIKFCAECGAKIG